MLVMQMKRFLFFFTFIFIISHLMNSAYARESAYELYEHLYDGYGLKHKVIQQGAGLTFANQVKEANTIYEIRYEFDLGNRTVTIPENSVLLFSGGVLKNGILVGNNTYLEGRAESILEKSLKYQEADKFHLGRSISFPKNKDISALAQKMLDDFNVLVLQTGTYYLSSPLIIKNHYAIIRGEGKSTILTTNKKLDYAIRTAFNNEVKSPGRYYNVSFIEISNLKIDGGGSKNFKNGVFLDGPSCTVNNCFITRVQSVGIKLSEWCNNLFNCIITHCDIGVLITLRANGVNVCYNRIESNTINLVAHGFRGVNIRNNTLEGGEHFNVVVGSGQSCSIKDNYFEGYANSITGLLSTTENRKLNFSGSKELRGLMWIGPIILSDNNGITKVSYRIGSPNAPSSVDIQGNYVDIHDNDNTSRSAPEVYFALIGSCSDFCNIQNNILSHAQNAVCGFFDTDNAVLGNAEIINNIVSGTANTNKSLDYIYDNYSKSGWRAKNHIVGNLSLNANQ